MAPDAETEPQKPGMAFEGEPVYCPFHPKLTNALRAPWKLHLALDVEV